MEFVNPLTKADMERINNSLRVLEHANRMMDRACAAGMNCDEQRQKAKLIAERLELIRQHFGDVTR